jgi:hypothetical protein
MKPSRFEDVASPLSCPCSRLHPVAGYDTFNNASCFCSDSGSPPANFFVAPENAGTNIVPRYAILRTQAREVAGTIAVCSRNCRAVQAILKNVFPLLHPILNP